MDSHFEIRKDETGRVAWCLKCGSPVQEVSVSRGYLRSPKLTITFIFNCHGRLEAWHEIGKEGDFDKEVIE